MTGDSIEAYGGVKIPVESLQSLADQVNSTGIPWHVDHNMAQPLRVRSFEAFVESRPDGIYELRFEAELHQDDVPWIETHAKMSATVMAPLARDRKAKQHDGAHLRISADHAWFTDDSLIEAENQLTSNGIDKEDIQVERAYQFGFYPDPQIFIEVFYPFFQSMAPNVLWDAIKALFLRRRDSIDSDVDTPSVINISVVDGERSVTGIVSTTDQAVAQQAIDSINKATEAFFQSGPTSTSPDKNSETIVWDVEKKRWIPPGGA